MGQNKHQKGQSFVEYALILIAVAIVVVVIMALVAPAIMNEWQHAAKLLTPVSSWTETPDINK